MALVGLLLAEASAGIACNGTPGQPTRLPTRGESSPKLVVARFVAFGDSMTWGEDGAETVAVAPLASNLFQPFFQVSRPYPVLLQQQLAARYLSQSPTVDNQGKPAEAVTNPLTFPRFSALMTSGSYDVVLIMEGANDLFGAEEPSIDPAVIAGLDQMIAFARQNGVRPFLATIPPEQDGCCPDRGAAWTLVPEFNNRVRALAAQDFVPLVDVNAALAGDVAAYIGPDGLHPTQAGYEVIAATFFDAIKLTLEQP